MAERPNVKCTVISLHKDLSACPSPSANRPYAETALHAEPPRQRAPAALPGKRGKPVVSAVDIRGREPSRTGTADTTNPLTPPSHPLMMAAPRRVELRTRWMNHPLPDSLVRLPFLRGLRSDQQPGRLMRYILIAGQRQDTDHETFSNTQKFSQSNHDRGGRCRARKLRRVPPVADRRNHQNGYLRKPWRTARHQRSRCGDGSRRLDHATGSRRRDGRGIQELH